MSPPPPQPLSCPPPAFAWGMPVLRSLQPCLQPPCGPPRLETLLLPARRWGGARAGAAGGCGGLSGTARLPGSFGEPGREAPSPCPKHLRGRVPVLSIPCAGAAGGIQPAGIPTPQEHPNLPPAGLGVRAGCRPGRHVGVSLLPWFLQEGAGKRQSPSGLGARSRWLLHRPLFGQNQPNFPQLMVSKQGGATGLWPAEGGSDGSYVAPQLLPGDTGFRCGSVGVPRDHQHPGGWERGGGRRQLRSLLCWLPEDEPVGGEEEEMPSFSYLPSGKEVPRGGQGVRQGLILSPLRSGRARTSCSRCQKNLSLQTAVKVLYIFSILLIVAVTVLAALGEHRQGWEVRLLPPLLPRGSPPGILELPQSTLSTQAWRGASSCTPSCPWDARGTLRVMPPHRGGWLYPHGDLRNHPGVRTLPPHHLHGQETTSQAQQRDGVLPRAGPPEMLH